MESKYFKNELKPGGALTCPCGCGAKMSYNTIIKLDSLRAEYGLPIYVEQGSTCEDYSVNHVGRKPTSQHIDNGTGSHAVDIKHKTFPTKKDYITFIGLAVKHGFKGIGQGIGWYDVHKYDKRLHIDTRATDDVITWIYYDK